ncbi:hypothetical protein B0H11DRAFT_1901713 [Mycena galericulata]|nr:hypothetical protein B0H11DRAFT_1901713 [Mycena galericulata]
MRFSTVFFTLAPLVAAVLHSLRTVVMSARAPATAGNVSVCTDRHGIYRRLLAGANAECVNFSVELEPVSQFNVLYCGEDCADEQLGPVSSPGISDLNVQPYVDFNDHVSSFA